MIVDITYHCSMGCSHCMSDCKPDERHMSLQTFEDVLDFIKRNQIPGLILSGGEIFEHPEIEAILDMIVDYQKSLSGAKMPVTLITNGRKLSATPALLEKVSEMRKALGTRGIMVQVTDDPRFYPIALTDKEKYRLRKLDAIIDCVPTNQPNRNKCLYPQGRALENFNETWWNTNAPKCANVRLIALQKPGITFGELIKLLMTAQKFCTPTISPKGEIKLGESALCPAVASIYDFDEEIMKKIRNSKCNQCTYSIGKFKTENPVLSKLLYS